jgi:hypothetical protein
MSMRVTLWALLLLLLPVLGEAGGATGRPSPASGPAPRPDVFLGYSYTHAGEAHLNGWHASGTYPIGTSLRLVADLSGHYGSFAQADLSQASFFAGARWTWTMGRLAPFAEALLGGVRTKTTATISNGRISDSDADWGGALGGGLDYRIGSRWAARAQIDLLLLKAEGAWNGDPRLSLGAVYRFGR